MTAADHMKTTLRRRTILATAIAMIGFAGAANAYADPVDLQVVDRDTGQVLPVWRHQGRLFVAGEPAARYSLRVSNHTDGRVLVVLSVDGVNILTGETANYDQRGYVFRAHESYDVSGWRKSNTEVASFTFAPLPQSYAARTGRPGEVGVIGMAVFKEQVAIPAPYPEASVSRRDRLDEPKAGYSAGADTLAMRRDSSPAPLAAPPPPPAPVVVTGRRMGPAPSIAPVPDQVAANAPSIRQDEKLGTAHGAREWSVINIVNFDRATTFPQTIRQIEYDTYANLVASGVIYPDPGRRPRPFPSNPDGGYVPDPPRGR